MASTINEAQSTNTVEVATHTDIW